MSIQEDRRDVNSQRIPFEAIVELGGEVAPSSSFEAQGVNVSANGMQLRTAYLPDVGQPLLCRFGSGAQEISAEADVVWRREALRGGEFGIRFTNLDGASAAALWEMCGLKRGEPGREDSPTTRPDADPGTRVRLHIDGLGSPMKARVRGSTGDELLVGSNLEFLRVGRSLELEDVDHGGKRPAHIDRVDVEVDRASNVPQLVVTLRYDDIGSDHEPAPAAVRSFDATRGGSPAVTGARDATRPMQAAAEPPSADREEIEAARMMRSKFSSAAADLMPKVAELGARAKTTMGLLLSKAVERTKGDGAPRRTTSPPPAGALHASGKRVVRDGDDAEVDGRAAGPRRRKLGKKAMVALGGTTGLLTVLTVMALHKSTAPPPGIAVPAPESLAGSGQTSEPTAGQAALQANVPLFGPTALSATERVALASPSSATVPGATGQTPPGIGGSAPRMESVDDQKSSSDDEKSASSHAKVASFGHGKLGQSTVLHVKTDGEITVLHGARMPTGFTVTVPGRRTMQNGATLAGRDPRIASVRIANPASGAELQFQFKDGVPPYLVRAKGHELQIALGRAGDSPEDANDTQKRGVTAKKRAPETPRRSKR
jgi:hypothetical protein